MVIDKVKIEGFCSVISPVKYKFNRPGLNVIRGRNGRGKTTLFNALSWCLYKQTVKKNSSIDPWPHIIDSNYRGTKVVTFMHDDKSTYEIIRCKDFTGRVFGKKGGNRLIIVENGEEKFAGVRDKADHQKWIATKLGYSFDLFKSTVLFGQELKRLMQEDGPSKKKVFEEAFETTFILRAKDIVEKKTTDLNKNLTDLQGKLSLEKLTLTNLINTRKRDKEINKEFYLKQQYRHDNLSLEVAALTENLGEDRSQLRKLEHNVKKVLDLEHKLIKAEKLYDKESVDKELKLSFEISNVQDGILVLENQKNLLNKELINTPKKCPNCQQKLPKESLNEVRKGLSLKVKEIETKIGEYKEGLSTLKKKHKLAEKVVADQEHIANEIRYMKGTIENINNKLKALPGLKSSIDYQKKRIEDKLAEIEKIKEEKPPVVDIATLTQEIELQKSKKLDVLQRLRETKKEADIQNWLINDPLSNSGLKAFIFDSMLSRVNNYLKAYTQYIGFGVKVYIEMASAHKNIAIAISKGGDEVPYEDLSRGQKQLVDVIIAFALNDTVDAIRPINILLMDEIFESLSDENVEIVANIIQKKAAHKAIHLITHLSHFNPINSYRVEINQNSKGQTIVETKYSEN